MEITGARWSLEGAEAILRLRSLKASGDLDDYWQYHEQMEQERNHGTPTREWKAPKTHAARRWFTSEATSPAGRRMTVERHLSRLSKGAAPN